MWRRLAMSLGFSLFLAYPSVSSGAADASLAPLLQAAQAAQERGDEASAFALLRRVAIAEDPEGQYRLAILLEQPISGAQPDPAAAAYWYERAAEQRHAGSAKRLGDLYASGEISSVQSGGGVAPLLGEAILWYQRAADDGDAEAESALEQLRARSALADALLTRASGDSATARDMLEALAGQDDLEAMYWRGVMQANGEGAAADPAGAVQWYERAYQRGFGPAALALGRLYDTGQGMPRDVDQAYRMYSAAEARGSSEARAAIEGLNFECRFGSPPSADVDDALRAIAQQMRPLAARLLRPLAEEGNADAQYWLATATKDAYSWPFNHEDAIRWFRAAALQGDSDAAYRLALLFNDTVDRAGRSLGDAAEKVRWLRRAADAGHHDGAMDLGEAYRSGRGVAADRAEANRWYERAHRAEAGRSKLSRPACVEDASAPELLAAFLACNRGDATGLAGVLMPLAEAGNARAQAWVASLLEAGPGTGGSYDLRVQPNSQRAARWYAKAAEQGLPSAMHDYGVVLEHGIGVPIDEVTARGWYEKAAESGFEPAQ